MLAWMPSPEVSLHFLRTFVIVVTAIAIPRSIPIIKKGWVKDDKKLLIRGASFFVLGAFTFALSIILFPRIKG